MHMIFFDLHYGLYMIYNPSHHILPHSMASPLPAESCRYIGNFQAIDMPPNPQTHLASSWKPLLQEGKEGKITKSKAPVQPQTPDCADMYSHGSVPALHHDSNA